MLTCSYILGDELPFTVDAGVGALAGNLLLLLWDAAGRRGRPTRVQGTWDSFGRVQRRENVRGEEKRREHKGKVMKR